MSDEKSQPEQGCPAATRKRLEMQNRKAFYIMYSSRNHELKSGPEVSPGNDEGVAMKSAGHSTVRRG